MWNYHAPKQEERLRFVFSDKLECLFCKQIIRKLHGLGRVTSTIAANRRHDIRQRDAFFIPPEKIRKMIVSVSLVQVAEELIEALFPRQACCRGANIAESPFANQCRFVTGLLQHFRHGHIISPQRLSLRIYCTSIAPDARVPMMLSRHQHAA